MSLSHKIIQVCSIARTRLIIRFLINYLYLHNAMYKYNYEYYILQIKYFIVMPQDHLRIRKMFCLCPDVFNSQLLFCVFILI